MAKGLWRMTSISFKPLRDRVLVERTQETSKTKGGIVLPESAKKKQETARVIACGPGKLDKNSNVIEMPVKVGDVVLMDKYSGQEVTINDNSYIILKADDIIAIVE